MTPPNKQQAAGLTVALAALSVAVTTAAKPEARDALKAAWDWLRELLEQPPATAPSDKEALLGLAHAVVNTFVTKLCRADNVCAMLRAAGIGPEWDELMDLGRALPRTRVEVWQVQNLQEGCGACPAGRDNDLCLVSLEDIETGCPAPEECPLRDYGAVLLVGEPPEETP